MDVNIAEYTGNVIKVGGQCYQFVGVFPDDGSAVTSDAVFETCEECAQGSSAEDVSSAQAVSSAEAAPVASTCGGDPADPEIVLMITAADGDLPVTWCGITWVKSEGGGGPADPLPANQRRSGDPATVCPIDYDLTTTGNPKEIWKRNLAIVPERGMYLARRVNGSYHYNTISIENLAKDYQSWYNTSIQSTIYDIGILPFARPTSGDYRIPDDFFGFYTVGSITYTWDRGNGWSV